MSTNTDTITFTYKGAEFRCDWLNREDGVLSVRTDAIVDDQGIDQTEWPSDAKISKAVGRKVKFHDAGDHPTDSEAIFRSV